MELQTNQIDPMKQKLPFEISPLEYGAIMSALNNQIVYSIQAIQSLKKQAQEHAAAAGIITPGAPPAGAPVPPPGAGVVDLNALLGAQSDGSSQAAPANSGESAQSV